MWFKAPGFQTRILRSLATGGTLWPEAASFSVAGESADQHDKRGVKALLVVAHPDDESECAAVLYRITHELGGTVDQVIVTNGEAGYQHTGPAQAYYQLPLAREDAGRKHLPGIRRREVRRASQILGIRNTYFLDQKDTGFTFDPLEGFHNWDAARVRSTLVELIERQGYDLALTLLPEADTHGHHQTVAILVAEAVAEFAPEQRPAVVGVKTVTSEASCPFEGLSGFPLTRTSTREPAWRFDRCRPMQGQTILNYSIVVNWVIAEHKSQGMFQMELGRRLFEYFWLFDVSDAGGRSCWRDFLGLIDRRSRNEEIPPIENESKDHAYARSAS